MRDSCFLFQDYYGDPMDERVGCQPIECKEDDDCGSTEKCKNYQCKGNKY